MAVTQINHFYSQMCGFHRCGFLLRLLDILVVFSRPDVLVGFAEGNLTYGGTKLQRAHSFRHVFAVGAHVHEHAALQGNRREWVLAPDEYVNPSLWNATIGCPFSRSPCVVSC